MERVVMSTAKIENWWRGFPTEKKVNTDGQVVELSFKDATVKLFVQNAEAGEYLRDDLALCVLLTKLRMEGIAVPPDEEFLAPLLEGEDTPTGTASVEEVEEETVIPEEHIRAAEAIFDDAGKKPWDEEIPVCEILKIVARAAGIGLAGGIVIYAGYKWWGSGGDGEIVAEKLVSSLFG